MTSRRIIQYLNAFSAYMVAGRLQIHNTVQEISTGSFTLLRQEVRD